METAADKMSDEMEIIKQFEETFSIWSATEAPTGAGSAEAESDSTSQDVSTSTTLSSLPFEWPIDIFY